MKSFMLSFLVVVYSVFALAHTGEDHNLPTAIYVSIPSIPGTYGTTTMVYKGSDSTITTTLQPSSTVVVFSSTISVFNSILTNSMATPIPATSSITVALTTPTGSSNDSSGTVVSTSSTHVSATTLTLVTPTGVSSTTISVARPFSSTSATPISTSTVPGAAPTMGVPLGGLIGVAASVLAAL